MQFNSSINLHSIFTAIHALSDIIKTVKLAKIGIVIKMDNEYCQYTVGIIFKIAIMINSSDNNIYLKKAQLLNFKNLTSIN